MALSACQFCGRQNDVGAQFCSDCGKPLTKAAAARAAVAAGGGGGLVSRTSGPESARSAPADAPCPLCGSVVGAHGGGAGAGGGSDRRLTPDKHSDHSLTLVLVSEMATEVARFERKHATTTIGRTEGDIRFPEDQFLSPLHSKLSWEEGRLEVRDLGSRNGTWVFLEGPYRLTDGDLILIGSQVPVRSEDADFVLVDDHSRNGVAIADRGVMTLHHGSRIMVGDKLLRVELPGAAEAAEL
ncbi:MAG: hypothetical protein DMD59_09070 [Gemmatimonadetes bacterium]|nr:MAG: hypothetical protein DMD59_09070 [Gemmatimonadota bacterium]